MNSQVVLITGASRGIGKAVAMAFAQSGYSVALTATTLAGAEATANEISKACSVTAKPYECNVSQAGSVSSLFEAINKDFGRLDVLINNAGITKDALILRMKEQDWDDVLSVNLKGTFLCSKEAIKIMSKQRYGRIINISSIVGLMGNPGQANYCASKAGIIGLTKSIAKEYASRGITANVIAPGFIETDMTATLSEELKSQMLKQIPVGRFGSPDDIAYTAVFLASPQASYITGQVINVNGGMYM